MAMEVEGRLLVLLASLLSVAAMPDGEGGEETLVVCSGLSRRLSCGPGFLISVAQAEWGRSTDDFCQADEREAPNGLHRRQPCAVDVRKHIGRLCERRQSCTVTPTRAKLPLGHCEGAGILAGEDEPFLELTYQCLLG